MMAKKESSICVEVLYCFEAVLGVRINLDKFLLVVIGDMDDVDGLANILGCRVSSLPKKLYLSKGGRLTLFKSTLSNFPTSLFPVLVVVANKPKKLQRNYKGISFWVARGIR